MELKIPNKRNVLIVEPNRTLAKPYALLPEKYSITRVVSLEAAIGLVQKERFAFVLLSSSYNPTKLIDFLEELKNSSKLGIIPLVWVIDFSQRLHVIPGTSWGDKVGVAHSLSSLEEMRATLERLLPQVL